MAILLLLAVPFLTMVPLVLYWVWRWRSYYGPKRQVRQHEYRVFTVEPGRKRHAYRKLRQPRTRKGD
jgi:hypothetical protein